MMGRDARALSRHQASFTATVALNEVKNFFLGVSGRGAVRSDQPERVLAAESSRDACRVRVVQGNRFFLEFRGAGWARI